MQWPERSPARFASLLRTESAESCAIAILGVPDDTGVSLNKGIPGAALGPDALRVALTRYGVSDPEGWQWPAVYDAGDLIASGTLRETHDRLTHAAGAILDAGLFPVMIGGGHDLTFAFVRALSNRASSLGGIYLDAHLDVRAEEGSGMPFRRLVEDCGVSRLDAIGISPFANSREHLHWFHAHGGRIDALEPRGEWPGENLFFSLDLDVIDASAAPGVSARNPMGWTVERAAQWAHSAGANPRVRCFDLMELCPPQDESGRTSRVAAHLLLTFLRGFASRPHHHGGSS